MRPNYNSANNALWGYICTISSQTRTNTHIAWAPLHLYCHVFDRGLAILGANCRLLRLAAMSRLIS